MRALSILPIFRSLPVAPQFPSPRSKKQQLKPKLVQKKQNDGPQNEESALSNHEDEVIRRAIKNVVDLSSSVDHAREYVGIRLHVCADWRLEGVTTIQDLVDSYHSKDETAAHAVVLLDRFIAAKLCTSAQPANGVFGSTGIHHKAECFAIAAFMLATKFKDSASPCLDDLAHLARPPWPKDQIMKCEELVLAAIDWDLHVTTGVRTLSHSLHSFLS